ncbi:M16 family metallopeptidase [Bartonella tribocorum]|uniref:Processing protease protein n=1 Tax=Bartonella tribocorum (strain DSM 28219 / CCUG 45778 / CIP 105476 / IBS 506) TaxID=382640 RepID=A9IQS7_BART1|nr:pitrilysin family protein [Bartonella tribocorum]CAK01096.1 processing protease protein [Bartonella tribocorum CIP 105476]CDO48308.1 processing protease [Bartonella tribocorum]
MDVDVCRLSNGLTIATHTMQQIDSVALGIWVKVGSRNETFTQHGIAHLLEHMAFKGTENRTAFQIATDIEDVGGEINATTSIETTAYFARVLKSDIPLAIDILADILMHSKFDEDELEREKQVIFQEIGAAHDTPDDIVFDHFTETAFRHQSLGRSILGTAKTIRSFTSADLHDFINKQYSADRMIVVAAGAVKHESFLKEVENRLGTFRSYSTASPTNLANYVGGDFREYRDLMDTQIVLGFEGRAYHARDFYATQILSIILGGGMSSRLFQEVREKRGLCYSIYAFHWGFSDTGLFGVHAATGQEGLKELLPVILDELSKTSKNIQANELQRAQTQYRANLIMSQENPSSQAHLIARQILLYGRPIPMSETIERLNLITPKRLTDLAHRLFTSSTPTLTAVGPVGPLMNFDDLTSTLSCKIK